MIEMFLKSKEFRMLFSERSAIYYKIEKEQEGNRVKMIKDGFCYFVFVFDVDNF